MKVLAVGVSYHDVVQRDGLMRRHTKLPIILGYAAACKLGASTGVAINAAVRDTGLVKLGDRAGHQRQGWGGAFGRRHRAPGGGNVIAVTRSGRPVCDGRTAFARKYQHQSGFIFYQRARILGVGSARRDQLQDAVALAASGKIRPKVAATLPLDAVVEAPRMVEAGEAIGRVVLTP